MSAWQWIVAVHLVAWAAVAVLAWRHWRASRHTAGVEDTEGRQTWTDEPGDPTHERIDEADVIDMSPAINNRLDHIAAILPDHERPCLVPGCPENELGALRDYDAIVLDPKEQP